MGAETTADEISRSGLAGGRRAIDAFEEIWTAKEMTLLAEWGERNIAWLRSERLGE